MLFMHSKTYSGTVSDKQAYMVTIAKVYKQEKIIFKKHENKGAHPHE